MCGRTNENEVVPSVGCSEPDGWRRTSDWRVSIVGTHPERRKVSTAGRGRSQRHCLLEAERGEIYALIGQRSKAFGWSNRSSYGTLRRVKDPFQTTSTWTRVGNKVYAIEYPII